MRLVQGCTTWRCPECAEVVSAVFERNLQVLKDDHVRECAESFSKKTLFDRWFLEQLKVRW